MPAEPVGVCTERMSMELNFQTLAPSVDYFVDLGSGVWLMDSHKWAFVAWEQARMPGQRYALLHADFHWDGVDDFADDEAAQQSLLTGNAATLVKLAQDEQYIRYDSFIAPAIRRGLFAEAHFLCTEDNGNDVGLDQQLCEDTGTLQIFHEDAMSLALVVPSAPVIFDLCLDLFNRSDDKMFEGDLWPDKEILQFLETMTHHIQSAMAVTISLSFGYSGTEVDTRHLADLVVPRILALRQASPPNFTQNKTNS